MSAESLETCLEVDSGHRGLLWAVASRLSALEAKFPAVSQSLLSIIDQAIVSGTSFVSAVIVGRMTTPEEIGLYYLVLSVTLVAASIQDSAVWAPFMVYCKRRHGRELEEYSASVWMQLFLLTAICIAVLPAIILVLSAANHTALIPGLWILCIVGPLILLRQGARRFAFANLRVHTAIMIDAVVAAAQLGGMLLLGYLGHLTLVSIFAVMGGACGLAIAVAYLLDRPQVKLNRGRLLSDWQHNWAFAKWTLRSYLVGYTAPYALLWILGLTAGATEAGVLGVCTTLVGMTNVLVMGIDNVLTPQATHAFTTEGVAGLRRVLFRTAAVLISMLGGFCLFVLATGDWLTVLAFGSAGVGMSAILGALAVSALMNGIGVVAGNGLWAIDQPRPNFLADVFSMTVTLIAAAVLVLPLGALGAALATLAGMAAAAVVRSIVLARYLLGAELKHRSPASADEAPNEAGRVLAETAEATI